MYYNSLFIVEFCFNLYVTLTMISQSYIYFVCYEFFNVIKISINWFVKLWQALSFKGYSRAMTSKNTKQLLSDHHIIHWEFPNFLFCLNIISKNLFSFILWFNHFFFNFQITTINYITNHIVIQLINIWIYKYFGLSSIWSIWFNSIRLSLIRSTSVYFDPFGLLQSISVHFGLLGLFRSTFKKKYIYIFELLNKLMK